MESKKPTLDEYKKMGDKMLTMKRASIELYELMQKTYGKTKTEKTRAWRTLSEIDNLRIKLDANLDDDYPDQYDMSIFFGKDYKP